MFAADQWAWSLPHGQICRVIETEALWGETICRVWLPAKDTVMRVPAACLQPVFKAPLGSAEGIAYIAAAARVADALTHDVLLAPIESSVIPLPHQIRALSRAISGDRVRYLLADEVGLGKTIEAGLIMRELKMRGLVERTLIVAPKGLLMQWAAEMQTHFNEPFRLIIPGDFPAIRRLDGDENLWQRHRQVICPMDSVKPMQGRRGWSRERVQEYNRERFEDLIAAGWDLIIVDEAHRLGGSTEQVARHKLGKALADAAPYLLLLSATPHQGKTESFHRLISLLDPEAFPAPESVSRERVQPYVIRTEKRHAIDAKGRPLFKPRRTELVPIAWESRHNAQRLLYEAVTQYIREGYNRALREKRTYIGFLMMLMQRLVVSSTRAIHASLERRLEVLRLPQEQLSLFPMVSEEEWAELDGQEQMDTLLASYVQDMKDERREVEFLLEAAARCEQQGPDAKAEALLDWIYRLQAEEGDPALKVLVFTEFVPTQEMLRHFLTARGFEVACINGSMGMEERLQAQEHFAGQARILISTDAGGEGLNLQFCHVVINYDMPWNPMKLEQRIGRVDRIGQEHVVRAINFELADTVEHRVREVLEEKLAIIFHELGIDKTSDVLDSAIAGPMFDHLYVSAVLDPESIDERVEQLAADIQEQARQVRESASILGATQELDPREAQALLEHPLPYWVERMTVNYLRAHGGSAGQRDGAWNLSWPDGETMERVVFSPKEAAAKPWSRHLTLEHPKVRRLIERLPPFVPGQPVAEIHLPDLPAEVSGLWSIWAISMAGSPNRDRRLLPLFLAEDGRALRPTAQHIWDRLLTSEPKIEGYLKPEETLNAYTACRKMAEEQGQAIYEELLRRHNLRLERERAKREHAFEVRRKAIQRIGLSTVRAHRLRKLEEEIRNAREELEAQSRAMPELQALLVLQVRGGADA